MPLGVHKPNVYLNGLSHQSALGQILLMLQHINLTYCICFRRHPSTGGGLYRPQVILNGSILPRLACEGRLTTPFKIEEYEQ